MQFNWLRGRVVGVVTLGLWSGSAWSVAGVSSSAESLTLDPVVGQWSVVKASAAAEAGSGESEEKLSLKLANPVADLISIPFQFNYDEGYGPKDAGWWKLNIQPVIPLHLNADWNLISRTILPVLYNESPASGVSSTGGLGDTTQSFFLSPTAGGLIWGVGPVLYLPTATEDELGAEKWGAGPTAVVLKQFDGWTVGVLTNHIWSFAGDDDRENINSTFLQPFLSYTFKTATSITLNTESTYDWNDSEWTVPINLVGAQILRVGKLPVQFGIGGRYYAESPSGGPEWGMRFQVTILLPG
jgi:hypothetical protein